MWSVKCEVRSEKCGLWSVKCGLWSVKCGLWSVKCEVCSVKCEVCSVKCEVWGLECEGSSEKWEVWSVKCGVWSLKFGVRRVQCAVWDVECRGKDTVGTGCLWTIGHLYLGNFRRRLARVYVMKSRGTLTSEIHVQFSPWELISCGRVGTKMLMSWRRVAGVILPKIHISLCMTDEFL